MKNSTSGWRSASQTCTGSKALKMGAQTGSSCLFLSKAKPMVGVWEQATAPMMRAMMNPRESVDVTQARLGQRLTHGVHVQPEFARGEARPLAGLVGLAGFGRVGHLPRARSR